MLGPAKARATGDGSDPANVRKWECAITAPRQRHPPPREYLTAEEVERLAAAARCTARPLRAARRHHDPARLPPRPARPPSWRRPVLGHARAGAGAPPCPSPEERSAQRAHGPWQRAPRVAPAAARAGSPSPYLPRPTVLRDTALQVEDCKEVEDGRGRWGGRGPVGARPPRWRRRVHARAPTADVGAPQAGRRAAAVAG